MRTFPMSIVTPDGEKYKGNAESLLVRTGSGDLEILAGHTPCLSYVATGRVRVRFPDGEERFASASGGFLSVMGSEVELIATTFEWADEIDLARAQTAKENATNALTTQLTEREHLLAKAKLERALCRIDVASYK